MSDQTAEQQQEQESQFATPSYDSIFPTDDSPVGDPMMPDYTSIDEDNSGIIDIDVTDIKNPYEPAPQGNYRLRITKYAMSASKAGSPMIESQYDIIGPDGDENIGKTVFDYMVVQGNGDKFGKWRHRQITEAVGLPLAGGVKASAYVGKEFDAELAVQEGNDQNPPKNVIRNVFV
jgi:hypothetical protein